MRLALGAAVALSPVLVRAAWFGQADAPSLLCLVLAFALLARSRLLWAAGFLAGAVLLKQFALVAVPFFAVMLLQHRVNRTALTWSAVVFAAVLAAGFLPFLLADARAVWEDTIRYEPGRTGSSATNFRRSSSTSTSSTTATGRTPSPGWWRSSGCRPTLYLLWQQRRSNELWEGAAAFAVSIFTLLFIARVFQTSYLAWPLVGVALAAALAASWRRPAPGA